MSTIRTTVVAGLVCLLGGCTTVSATRSPHADLAQYRTFAFFQPADARSRQLAFERSPAGQVVRDRITDDLTQKGLVPTEENPDLLVAYHTKLQQKTDVDDWGYRGYYWGAGPISIDQYTQGTLFIDLIDPKTRQVMWRGTASAIVDNPANPNLEKLSSAVDKVMKKYPAELASSSRPAM